MQPLAIKRVLYFLIAALSFNLPAICLAEGVTIFEADREIKLGSLYKITECHHMGKAECRHCFDRSSYYFELGTKQIISRCGGACWHPREQQKVVCETQCPPPEWNCDHEK